MAVSSGFRPTTDDLVLSSGNKEIFMNMFMQLMKKGVEFKLREPVINFVEPGELNGILDRFTVKQEGIELVELLNDFETLGKYSLNFSSSNFLAQPDSGNSIAGLLGEIGKVFLQQNTVNYEYSPAATLLEIKLLTLLREIIGYQVLPNPELLAVNTGGAFTFGGYGSNLSCLLAAREKLKEKLRAQGKIFNPRRTKVIAAVPFAHYSLRRSLDILGLGNKDLSDIQLAENGLDREATIHVETEHFRMNISDLERKIMEAGTDGTDIMAIYAIAGESRAMGFDQLAEIAELARKHDIWLHVDACQGGQCLFSPKLRRTLLNGIEQCDSIALDPHKVFLLPYNLSAFFLRNPKDLYLLPKGSTIISNEDDSLGKFTPGIGSKGFISLKLYFMLRHWGLENVGLEIDRRHELALRTVDMTGQFEQLVVLNPEPQHNSVMLMYKTPGYRHDHVLFNQVNQKIHKRMTEQGTYMVHTFPSIDDESVISSDKSVQFYPLRLMFGNPNSTEENILGCLKTIIDLGDEILREHHVE
ncbi:hypothetical protein AMQ83_29115 [Paenibacillus riograndensis]|nr:hypothetical protein AMQ83_29115 [Paenibacillus riograndensis]